MRRRFLGLQSERSSAGPPSRSVLSGRLAGVLLIGGGALTVLTALLPQPPDVNRLALVFHAAAAMLLGGVAWFVPWDGLPRRSLLVLPLLAMALVGSGNVLGHGQPYTLGVYFILIFTWIGVTQPPGTSLLFAPPAILTYVASILMLKTRPNAEASSAAFVIPVGVLLGESLAWLTGRLRRSEDRAKKEQDLLKVMQQTAVASNKATTVEEALGRCLDSVCKFKGWPVGHAFQVTEDQPARLRSSVWRLEDPERFEALRRATEAVEYGLGVGVPGKVAASAKPLWISDVRDDPDFLRGRWVHDLGVRASLSFPVLVGTKVAAVLEFFSDSPEEPDEEVILVMAHVGEQLGRVLERDRSDRTIVEAQRRLAEAQQMAHVGSWEWDVTANIVSCSRELLRLIGLEGEGSVRSFDEFLGGILPEEATWLRETMTMQAHTGVPVNAEVHHIGPGGELRDYYLQGRLVGSAVGGLPKMIGTLQDITNRTRAERELEGALASEREAQARLRAADAMKSTLLHAVAHDLRTPLASILASVSLLLDHRPLSAELRERLLSGLLFESQKMDRLLGDLLDLDRIERGVLEPNRQPTDVGALVRRVLGDTKGLDGRSVTINSGQIIAEVEESKVERILENLLRNFVAHTPPTTPAWITLESKDGGVLIAVDDAGPGVTDAIKASIFEPFKRGSHRAENVSGFGIGLSLVARFAELHGGRAWVEDRPGGGASFRVLLPCPVVDAGSGRR
jgi:signal transduction histidine kinase